MLNKFRREAHDPALDESVTSLLVAAAAPTEPGPVPGEAQALATFRASQNDPRRSSVLSSLIPVKAAFAAALGAGVLLTGGAGAAAAGSLPDPAQDTASQWLAKVGVTVPGSDVATEHDTPPAADKGTDVSELARETESTGVDKGAEVSDLASDGKSKAGDNEAPETTPHSEDATDDAAVEVPNSGGTGTADDATAEQGDGASASGTEKADETSSGKSTAGSANGR